MSAFTCYFDTSGTQHDKLVLVAAGFMSTAEQWINFEAEWKDRLASFGLTHFHRKEIPSQKKRIIIPKLAEIIKSYAMRKFAMVVMVGDLHDSVPEEVSQKWHLDAYSYANRACAAHIRIWARNNCLRSVPEIVFATGDAGRYQLEARLRVDEFTGYRFQPALDQVDRKTKMIVPAAIALQAADLLAGEMYGMTVPLANGLPVRRDTLTDAWFILNKIPGEPQVLEGTDLKDFEQQIATFTGSPCGIKISRWLPPPGAVLERK